MRYLILKTPTDSPVDPRELAIRDTAHLHEILPPIADCAKEAEAVGAVRRIYPNAFAMPFPVTIGSGQTVLIGLLAGPDIKIDADDTIPFVLFVQPVAQHEKDKASIQAMLKGRSPTGVFDEQRWRLLPIVPKFAQTTPIEWRTSELRTPAFLDAKVGYDDQGRLVIYAEMGEHSMSITMRDTNYRFIETSTEVPDRLQRVMSDKPHIVGG